MAGKIEISNLHDLFRRYQAGEPENKLAREAGISRTTMRRRLLEAGIIPRDISGSMYLRWAEANPKQRQAMLEAAHAATRGIKVPISAKIKHALTVENKLLQASPVELEFAKRLQAYGFKVIPQKAVYIYNLDIAIQSPPIAIEIYGGRFHSMGNHLLRHFKRTKYLLNHGWSVIIIWIDALRYPLSLACDDYIIRWADELRRNPTARSQYRVILGNGQPAPIRKNYLNTPSAIKRLGCP